ncbi:MAG: DUF58 domain-containing protein [Planctomycetota bacterium]
MKPVRTRVRIGSGGVLYLIVSLMILASAFYTQANLLFWGFGLTVGGLVVSLGAAAVALRGLGVSRIVPRHGAAGEALALRYHVHNRGWLPVFGVVIREDQGRRRGQHKKAGSVGTWGGMLAGAPQAWLLHLGPGQTAQTAAPCRPQRRGKLRFEQIEVSTSFPFGVIHKTVMFVQENDVQVFPHLYRARRQLLGSLTAGGVDSAQTLDRGGGGGDFFGVRPYRPGDSPRNIDWKRTARTGELVARELTMPSPPLLNLVLDLRETPPMAVSGKSSGGLSGVQSAASGRQLEERAISLAASLICDAYLRGFKVGLKVLGLPDVSFRAQHSLSHRTQLLESLADLDLNQPRDESASPDLRQAADVVVWAGRGSSLPLRLDGTGRTASVVGAADFDRYVSMPTALDKLESSDAKWRHSTRRPPRSAFSGGVQQMMEATA